MTLIDAVLWGASGLWFKHFVIQVRLNEMLEERGVTRYWLAKETGIQYGTLIRIGRAKASNRIELGTLGKICQALKCQPGDLLVSVDDGNVSHGGKRKR